MPTSRGTGAEAVSSSPGPGGGPGLAGLTRPLAGVAHARGADLDTVSMIRYAPRLIVTGSLVSSKTLLSRTANPGPRSM